MRYENVCLAGVGCTLPDERGTSHEIENRLSPLYTRLKLPEGRLALMSGIEERRFWERGTLPSDHSIRSVQAALDAAEIDPSRIGALFHASVCRDRLEPATACRVHAETGLASECTIFDMSNACLGLLNGMIQVANMIELGQIDAGIVVGSEGARELVETTIAALNADESLTRKSVKPAIASLTIGSASCALLLTHRRLAPKCARLRSAVARAYTEHHQLCQSGQDEAVATGMQPLMETDAETLMQMGVQAAKRTFESFLATSGWSHDDIDRTICHQVGSAHQKLLLETLHLPAAHDFTTYPWLGNTGAAALPTTLAVAADQGGLQSGHNVGLLGIGSGLNVIMMGVEWAAVPCQIRGNLPPGDGHTRRTESGHGEIPAATQPPHHTLDQRSIKVVDFHPGIGDQVLGIDRARAGTDQKRDDVGHFVRPDRSATGNHLLGVKISVDVAGNAG